LADPLQVWATGRTVQCGTCGQRWRAVGEGVRPAAEAAPSPPAEPPAENPISPVADPPAQRRATVDEPPSAESSKVAGPDNRTEARAEPSTPEPAEGTPQPKTETRAAAADWRAAPPDAPPPSEASVEPVRPPTRLTSSFGTAPSRVGRWVAIAFLVMIALAAVLMFRDVIVSALPGLAPIYAAMGLLVHPAAVPHG
jgi:hypothetical protein